MDTDVHTHPKEQVGKPVGAEPVRLDLRGKSVAEITSILTSPPIGCEDGIDDPLSHASPLVSPLPSVVPEPPRFTNAPPTLIADAPATAPGTGGPNLDLQPLKPHSFEGEVALEGLAHRSSHDPGLPQPPIQAGQRTVVARFGRLSFVAILAGIVAIGVLILMTFPNEVRERSADISRMVTTLFEDSSRARTWTKSPRLVVKRIKGLVNEPLSLGVSINNASGEERVILAGFAVGTSLSTGTPLGLTSWQMLARDVGNAFVYAPKDFVGTMVAAIDLRSPSDWLLDTQTVRLEWVPAARQAPRR
jgi:hypothetical protein